MLRVDINFAFRSGERDLRMGGESFDFDLPSTDSPCHECPGDYHAARVDPVLAHTQVERMTRGKTRLLEEIRGDTEES